MSQALPPKSEQDASYDTRLLINCYTDKTFMYYGDNSAREDARAFLEERYGVKFSKQFERATRPHYKSRSKALELNAV